MNSKFLYHGSRREIKGDRLLPRQATDLGERPENLHKAVYSTDIKELAITMAILGSRGVNSSSLGFDKKSLGIIYEGWPTQKNVYLYTLPTKTFKQEGPRHQYYSTDPVKPIKIEKLVVQDYLHLVRKATKKEKKMLFEKYKIKS